ncbi:hypothetical protein L207DRAFT_8189 [Hyaloscypha variabilis F]|jgi:hypothetical protein|uniref:Uncharacterized protein n=1 Tax=Hyaloscypha variabilis (strain UAMH 11265 / GT02V1 / F) TaxID=1149755 RepID=A0A2J6SCL0_HYAVF|nr:hypothetical protein L207DRAFT_8189 [Hyaloscypha variabilis F]
MTFTSLRNLSGRPRPHLAPLALNSKNREGPRSRKRAWSRAVAQIITRQIRFVLSKPQNLSLHPHPHLTGPSYSRNLQGNISHATSYQTESPPQIGGNFALQSTSSKLRKPHASPSRLRIFLHRAFDPSEKHSQPIPSSTNVNQRYSSEIPGLGLL